MSSIAYTLRDIIQPVLFGQSGGGQHKVDSTTGLLLFGIIIILFLIRSYIVQFAFNRVVPSLIVNTTAEPDKILNHFRPLSYVEAIFLTLLISSLFSCC